MIEVYFPQAMMIIGILAFVVSVIIEVIKNVSFLKNIPTDLVVIVLSEVLTVLSFLAYMSYNSIAVTWYLAVGSFIAGFFVAFVAMYGWDKITELYKRFK